MVPFKFLAPIRFLGIQVVDLSLNTFVSLVFHRFQLRNYCKPFHNMKGKILLSSKLKIMLSPTLELMRFCMISGGVGKSCNDESDKIHLSLSMLKNMPMDTFITMFFLGSSQENFLNFMIVTNEDFICLRACNVGLKHPMDQVIFRYLPVGEKDDVPIISVSVLVSIQVRDSSVPMNTSK